MKCQNCGQSQNLWQLHWPYRKWGSSPPLHGFVGFLPKNYCLSFSQAWFATKAPVFPGLGPLNRTDADGFLQFMLKASPWLINGCSQWVLPLMNRAQDAAVQLGIVWCCFIGAFVKCCDGLRSEIKNMLLPGCTHSLLQVLGKISCVFITMKKQNLPVIPSVPRSGSPDVFGFFLFCSKIHMFSFINQARTQLLNSLYHINYSVKQGKRCHHL